MANLSKGTKGKSVTQLQKALNKNGAKPKLKEDSIFGPLTDAAVRSYQKKKKMKVDGVVGPLTGFSMGISSRPKSLDWPVADFEKTHKFLSDIEDTVDGDMHKYLNALKTAIKESDEIKKALIARAKMMKVRHDKVLQYFQAKFVSYNQLLELEKASASSTDMDEIQKIHDKAQAAFKDLTNKDYEKAQTSWVNFYETVDDVDKYQEGVKALKSKLTK